MITVVVRQGNLDVALQVLKKRVGPHLKEVVRRVRFAKPSERRKAKKAIAKRRKKKVERRWREL